MSAPPGEITKLLEAWNGGDHEALKELMDLVYEELRSVARHLFARESSSHTLQPTAVVSELYLRLEGQRKAPGHNRKDFFSFAVESIRRILVDYARRRDTWKRGGHAVKIPLHDDLDLIDDQREDHEALIALDEALENLAKLNSEQSLIMQLRLFAGMTSEEIAAVRERPRATVYRHLKAAKLFLTRELSTASREDDEE